MMQQTGIVNTRALVLDILIKVLEKGGYCNVCLKQVLDKYSYLDKRDRAFVSRLALGTVERAVTLDACIETFSSVPMKKMKPVIRNILRMSAYQMYEMSGVTDHSICNEAVKLTQKRGFRNLQGFVNGVLRNMLREATAVLGERKTWALSPKEIYETLFPVMPEHARWGLPMWLYQMLQEQYPTKWEAILAGFMEHREKGTGIHLVRRGESSEVFAQHQLAFSEQLESKGISWQAHPYLPELIYVQGYDRIEQIPGYEEGAFFVQDISSALVGVAAEPLPGFRVCDLCAAPGGKTVHVADTLGDTGTVICGDVSPEKVSRIMENIMRLGLTNVSSQIWDASVFDPEKEEKFDLVLVDAPCSGIGIIGNKPDIKYHLTPEGMEELVTLQGRILQQAAAYVKPGGTLLYSTCTLNRKENEGQVTSFMENHPEFEADVSGMLKAFSGKLQEDIQVKDLLVPYGVVLLPGVLNSEGFFISRLRKKERPES